MTRFRLEKEEKVGILLQFAVIGVVTFSRIYVFKCSFDFSLLYSELDSMTRQEAASVLHPKPFCFGSTVQCESPDSARPAPAQSSFWTELKSLL